jgi:hypothetical protein
VRCPLEKDEGNYGGDLQARMGGGFFVYLFFYVENSIGTSVRKKKN